MVMTDNFEGYTQIVPFSFWDSDRVKAFLDDMIELVPENEGIWLSNEDIYYAAVYILQLDQHWLAGDDYFTYRGYNFYNGVTE
jgi:hypothetical protein